MKRLIIEPGMLDRVLDSRLGKLFHVKIKARRSQNEVAIAPPAALHKKSFGHEFHAGPR